MFDAAMFLAGSLLFLCAVLFFIFVWQDRVAMLRKQQALEVEHRRLREQRVDLDIREHELAVWQLSLENEQRQLELVREEVRMLTASSPMGESATYAPRQPGAGVGDVDEEGSEGGPARCSQSREKTKLNKEVKTARRT